MFYSQVRLPVALESVDADLSARRHVGVEDLGKEEALGRRLRKVLVEGEFDPEPASDVRRVSRPVDHCLQLGDVVVVDYYVDPFQWLLDQFLDLLGDVAHHLWIEILHVGHHGDSGAENGELIGGQRSA